MPNKPEGLEFTWKELLGCNWFVCSSWVCVSRRQTLRKKLGQRSQRDTPLVGQRVNLSHDDDDEYEEIIIGVM